MNIVGISAFHCDASATLVCDGKLEEEEEEEEERLNRSERCARSPAMAVEARMARLAQGNRGLTHRAE